ncbi:beta-glucoside-specific PTS transporter subunit IIABC [Tetragenococcus koreensis]|uniref:PTS system sucrose-specific EIIBCA component n=1 Tax=Tetragenococcus koreensis TaxID=290335 RepID=A0AAN4ZS50_9ENTE|nr:beta-glucoside-specific PTS transporter subunit IIABC [Tetragenococcus koreensis]MDN6731006.1 beta-glucoside-specific PTS transporter subunit IIABC [Atopostipes suicloacalis]MCF1618147.1 beta-glucoside-specific PTS transporter subunit IIABC [Tetragenococcus koreensis]MCF1623012.1 beta-glucoside-specific PTS transporter subunit IIABC [Tetragenococcus koreensis]MCF1627187.1 beta-glucoside-specific PTS transporter subunit IIABC [Tetragenococcus koreensis]MCF1632645.1 beta-glucoside-specific PT
MNYKDMCQQIIKNVGGEKNIRSVVHCATRLRFVLKDESKADDKTIQEIPGVLSLVKKAGQYQLVIGNNVDEVYKELATILKIDEDKKDKDDRKIFDKVIGSITGSIAPVIPLLAGAGMGKVLLLILTLTGLLAEGSQTYIFLDMIFDTAFYFMPAYVGFSAAKIFNANQYLGAFIGLITVHPVWTDLVSAETPFQFLGINVDLVSYSSTLIPAILSVWIMSYIEKGVKKITPEMIKVFAEPLLVMLLTAPLTFIIIGPIGDLISRGVGNFSMFLFDHGGFIAIPILAAVYPWLVSIGIHKALSPISIALVAEQGFDPIIRVVALCSNISQAAASLAVSFKTKNKKLKSLAMSSSMTAFLGGITEPAMYGVNLKLKKPMYASMIGGAIAGLFAGLFKLKAFIYVTPGILSLPMWISNNENYVVLAIVTMVIATVATFTATWIIGFDDSAFEDKETNEDNIPAELTKQQLLKSPVAGEIEELKNVSDQTFSSEIMGKGIAIIPSANEIFSPGTGEVTATFKTNHAIGLKLESDIELLIHIGIDTVSLDGEYFDTLVEKGDKIQQGTKLISFDLEAIKAEGYDPTVMIIITNSNDFLDVLAATNESVVDTTSDLLLIV